MLHRWHPQIGLAGLHRAAIPISRLPGRSPWSHKRPCFLPIYIGPCAGKAIWTAKPLQKAPPRQRRKDTVPTADTIYALSTAAGRAAIAVVRLSGPACLDIYGALCPDRPFPSPRVATLRRLKDPKEKTRVLDAGALVLYFPAPNTVTGDDVLEFHVHGGPAIVRSILEAIPNCADTRSRRRTADYSLIRAAEPGEFTKRAFYNGRLDLTQAEALGETLAAETEQQRRLAVAGGSGRLATRYEEWRKALLYARGQLEAVIDFSEDQHFDESAADLLHSIAIQVDQLSRQLRLHIHNASRGELLRNGIDVSLLGAPNAGKSSLLNQIVGREAAIVSTEAGTTRDVVDVSIDVNGWLVKLADMAGLRSEGPNGSNQHVEAGIFLQEIGQVEREGMRRARQRALQSDLVIVVVALFRNSLGAIGLSIDPELVIAVEQCHHAGKAMIFAINKADLLHSQPDIEVESGLREQVLNTLPGARQDNVYLISCRDAALSLGLTSDPSMNQPADPGGVQTLLQGVSQTFSTMTSATTEPDLSPSTIDRTMTAAETQSYWSASLSVTHRQSLYLQRCLAHLEDFLAQSRASRAVTGTTSDDVRTVVPSSHHVDGHDDLVAERVLEQGVTQVAMDDELDVVTAAEHLRYAAGCLAKITGRGEGGDVEDVLGVVFEK